MHACLTRALSNIPHRRRAGITALAALGYLASIIGFPVLTPRNARPNREAYPCEHHHCDCASAEACWGHCCCFSLDERLAWAARHNIAPPTEIVRGIHPGKPPHAETHSCCAKHDECAGPASGQVIEHHQTRVQWIAGIQARGCHGQGTHWIVFSAPIAPPPQRVAWQPKDVLCDTLAEFSSRAPHLAYAPLARPG